MHVLRGARLSPLLAAVAAFATIASGTAYPQSATTLAEASVTGPAADIGLGPDTVPDSSLDSSVGGKGLASAVAAAFAQNAPAPPEPEHSGFKALFSSTVSDFASFPKRPSTWAILGMGAVGALAVHPADHHLNSHLVSDASGRLFAPGKWMGNVYVVSGSAVGLWLLGRWVEPHEPGTPRTSKLAHIGFDLIRTQIVSQAFVQGIKYAAQRDRPTGECCAFPSGHAASAFSTAAVLERHFGYRASWPALIAATYVAVSRLHDNRHFASDVVFGAAIGTASGWTVVGRHGRSNYALVPTKVPGGMAIMVARVN